MEAGQVDLSVLVTQRREGKNDSSNNKSMYSITSTTEILGHKI